MNDGQVERRAGALEAEQRLAFLRKLQEVTTKIHATANLDEIMLDLGLDFCDLFDSDRFTLYALTPEKDAIVSKVKTGLASFRDLRLPVGPSSIAGFVAQTRQLVNIADVYDEAELKRLSPELQFQQGVDQRTGYRTRAMLVAPLVAKTGELLGVVQFINHRSGGPFPAVFLEGVRQLCETLSVALGQRMKPRLLRGKYNALVQEAVLSKAELDAATRSARERGTELETVLIEDYRVRPAVLGAALASYFGVPYEAYSPERIRPVELLRNLKQQYVEENGWLPLEDGKDGLVVMALDPERVAASRIVGQVFQRTKVAYRVTTRHDLAQSIAQWFGNGSGTGAADNASVGELLSNLDENDDESDGEGSEVSEAVENELVKLVNRIIVDAYRQGASDIHIEPQPGRGKTGVRFRKDGTLTPYIEIPASYRNALVARIKIMCDLDISERRKPQDGKIKFKKYGPLDIELRVATVPSSGGVEDIVMRILQAGEPIPMAKLGILPHNLERLQGAIEKPYGLFFVCGPTGSGKTTTLHSILSHLNTPETKIWTAEDPVEITQKGLRQVQVNRKTGMDFATVMRSFLRADPDIIMVGEMRDRETVSTGIEASLTGHLVLSTLHTNSAPESIVRLLDMGMDPFNFADALTGILAQRLAKRLCTHCRQAYTPDDDELQALLAEFCEELQATTAFRDAPDAARENVLAGWRERYAGPDGRFTLYRAVGCAECGKGYRGRVGLHELMLGTDRAKRLLTEHARVAALLAQALEDGMRTLKMDGIEKVLSGITDIKMVRAVCVK